MSLAALKLLDPGHRQLLQDAILPVQAFQEGKKRCVPVRVLIKADVPPHGCPAVSAGPGWPLYKILHG